MLDPLTEPAFQNITIRAKMSCDDGSFRRRPLQLRQRPVNPDLGGCDDSIPAAVISSSVFFCHYFCAVTRLDFLFTHIHRARACKYGGKTGDLSH